MSIRIMTQVWDHGPSDKAETLVLLALADFCNDSGHCWPSVTTIAKKSRLSERGVQKVFLRLIESGWLEVSERKGRSGTNLYRVITPNPVHPEPCSPPEPRSENPEPRSGKPLEPSIYPPNPPRGARERKFGISENVKRKAYESVGMEVPK